MEHVELYKRLRWGLLSRRFAFNGERRVNMPSNDALLANVASRAEYDMLSPDDKKAARWGNLERNGENPWLYAAALSTALAVETSLGSANSRAVLISLLQSLAAQFRFEGAFAGYPIRWDPVASPANRWRGDGSGPQYSMEFTVTEGKYDFSNDPRDPRRLPRRSDATLEVLLGSSGASEYRGVKKVRLDTEADLHLRWEPSQDEVFGMLVTLFASHQISGDPAIQSIASAIMRPLAEYLSMNGYMIVKPRGGIACRGAGDSLVGSEFAIGRAFNTVLGSEFPSLLDWQGVMTRAGYWSQLEGPIAGWSVLGGLASIAGQIIGLGGGGELLSTFATAVSGGIVLAQGVLPHLVNALRDPLLEVKLGKALAVIQHSDCFDPFDESFRTEHATSLFLYEYDRRNRFLLYTDMMSVLPGSRTPVNFMGLCGLFGLHDTDATLRNEFDRWLTLRASPLGMTPRGFNPRFPLFTRGIECLVLTGAGREVKLRDELDMARASFERDQESDLPLVEGERTLSEDCGPTLDYMAGLALAWLHAQRQSLKGVPLLREFPAPPSNFGAWPRPTAKDGTDLFPGDKPAARAAEPPVRIDPPPDTSVVPAVDKTVVIKESDGDVDTGIAVHYGEIVRITAAGSIQPAVLWGSNGPAGVAPAATDARWPVHAGLDATSHRFSLLARLNGWFEVGEDSGEVRWLYDAGDEPDAARKLSLRINDDVPGNGAGEFTARVRVWGQPRITLEDLEVLGYAWIFPPSLRFAVRCVESCGAMKVSIFVRTMQWGLVPIVGNDLGLVNPGPELLHGIVLDLPVVLNPSFLTSVFWLGGLGGGRTLYGRNGVYEFVLQARSERGYFCEEVRSAAIQWHGSRISCIRRDVTHASHRIVAVGGVFDDRREWTLDVDRVITEIERGQDFYVERPAGEKVAVIVARTPAGRKYLKTEADGETPNNLLALPECSA